MLNFRFLKATLLFLLFTIVASSTYSQVTIYSEDFLNQNGKGAVGPTPTIDISGVSWSVDISGADLSATTDWFRVVSNAMEARDVDGPVVWISPSVDISAFTDVELSLFVSEIGDHENDDYVDVEYSTNGGSSFTKILNWNNNGSATHTLIGDSPNDDDWLTENITVSNLVGSSFILRVTAENNAGAEFISFDNITLEGIGSSPDPEPSAYPTNFSCSTISDDQIDLSWTDETAGTQLPSGYLIKWSDIDYSDISDPMDLSTSNGSNSTTIAQGIETISVFGLNPNTIYYFKIWPYTNSGANIDYKTSPGVPLTECQTEIAPCILEDFDTGLPTSYSSVTSYALSSGTWSGSENQVIRGTTGVESGSFSLQLRSQTGSNVVTPEIPSGVSQLSFYLTASTSSGSLQVNVSSDNGGSWTQATGSPFSANTSTQFISINIDDPNIDRVQFRRTASTIYIDDVLIDCFNGCSSIAQVDSYFPTSGPSGTMVTILGVNFAGATAIEFGGVVSGNVNVIDDETIVAEVPNNAQSGVITVFDNAGCPVESADTFTVIEDFGTCGISASGSEIFISEVYDGPSQSLSYFELFNPTSSAINLASGQYKILITTHGNANPPCNANPQQALNLTGIIPSGGTYVVLTGTGTTCSVTPDQTSSSTAGINGNDLVELLKGTGNTVIDQVENPGYDGNCGITNPGFVQRRLPFVNSPSATYIASQWTNLALESCDDLGNPPYSVGSGSNVTLNNQPDDYTGCTNPVSFNISWSGTGAGPNSTQWKVYNPFSNVWENADALESIPELYNPINTTGTSSTSFSTTMNINGNTAQLLDYQFYAEVTRGGCSRVSKAVQYEYETREYYRSKVVNGIWDNSASWEMSNDGISYVDACRYPVAENSSEVLIRDGQKIILNITANIQYLEIESNAELEYNTTSAGLNLLDRNVGTDFLVNGVLADKAVSPNGTSFESGATWQLGPDATIIKTNTSSTTNYRDNYETGIANIPASATWIYRRESATDDVSVVAVGNMVYPNLIFENFVSDTYNPLNTIYFFNGASSAPIIKGDLNIGGTGTGDYVVRHNNINDSPILIEGDLIVKAGSSLINASYNGASSTGHGDGTGFEVYGNIEIDGLLNLSSGTIGEGILLLSGDGDQLGIGDGNTVSVNEFEINKPSGDFFTEFSLNVNREARFIAGIYEIDDLASNPADVEFSTSATAVGMSNASFVDGTVVKFGSASFDFPIGDTHASGNSFYQPLVMFGLTETGGFSARYFAEEHPNAGLYYDGESNNVNDFQEIGNCDHWRFERESGSSDPRFGVRFTNVDPEYCNVVGAPEFIRISRWNGLSWDEIPSADNGNEIQLDQAVGVAVGSDYGEFVLSGPEVGNSNVLPITLLFFRAEAKEQQVITDWITAAEINNDYFTIERSKDGNLWEKVGTVDGAGDSHTELSYSLADNRPYSGISYYRLRQTDYDGATTLSEPRAVEIRQDGTFGIDKVYRGQEGLNLVYRATAPYVVVEIYDLLGKRIHSELLENSGNGFGTIYPDLAKGAYLLRLSHGSEFDSEKFVW